MERRAFIKTASAGMLASMIMPRKILSGPVMTGPNIGLQLYSIRNELKGDLEGGLKKLSEIGYYNLEAAGYSNGTFYGHQPAEFKKLVEKYGMRVSSSHLTFSGDEIPTVLSAHKEAGIKYLVWPWLNQEQRSSIESYLEIAQKLNTIGEFCRENDLEFGYHNHDFEFYTLEEQIPYNILLENTDPKLVFMQLDLYWIVYAGLDPVHYFENYPGRFKLWHIKDMTSFEDKQMTEVGSGVIDYEKLFSYRDLAGMNEFFIEQDAIKGDAFESVKKSFDYLNNLLG